MKTRWFVLPVVIVLFMTGACSIKELDLIQDKEFSQELVFTAQSAERRTKTALQADEKSIWWSPGDEISIFYGASEGCRFTSTNTEEVAKTVFRGTLDAFTGETEAGDFNYFWAVYPYSSAVSCDGSSLVANLSDHQVGKSGTFAPNTNIAIAKSLGLSLGFYNACSWFRFSIKKEGVKRVIFRGNNNEDVAGKFSVSMDSNGTPTAPTVVDGKKEIVLTMPNDGTFTVGEMYYITLLPQVFQNGFTVTFETDEEIGSRSITAKATYLRSKYNTGIEFDKSVEYTELVPVNEIWYTSSTGNVVNPHSTINIDANILSNTYSNGRGIIVFDVPPTIIGNGTFAECDDLISISLPKSVTSIGDAVFKDCVGLTSIIIPEDVTSIGVVAFSGCTSLEEIVIPNSVQELGDGCFSDCSSLVRASLPANLSIISANCFDNCSSLSVISIPSNTTKIERYAFRECTSLSSGLTLPESVWYIGYGAFRNCTSLSKLYILRETAATIESDAFDMCPCYIYVPSVSLERYSIKARSGTLYGFKNICSFDAENIEPVDLGLSIMWAPVNVGATTPTNGGGLFAWGEITTKEDYLLSTYKWYDSNNDVYTKYTNVSEKALNGNPDGHVTPYYYDDAARMNWGSDWRMPSSTEIAELLRECVWTPVWTPDYGGLLRYMRVTGPNGNSIILPTNNYYSGYYWSRDLLSALAQYQNEYAYGLVFYPDEDYDRVSYLGAQQFFRTQGLFVRPVYEKL